MSSSTFVRGLWKKQRDISIDVISLKHRLKKRIKIDDITTVCLSDLLTLSNSKFGNIFNDDDSPTLFRLETNKCYTRLIDKSTSPELSEECCYLTDLKNNDIICVRFIIENIGPTLRLSVLAARDEFNQSIKEKVHHLSDVYDSWRRIRGDGNCYYRSVIFGLLEQVVRSKSKDGFKQLATAFIGLLPFVESHTSKATAIAGFIRYLKDAHDGRACNDVLDLEADVLDEYLQLDHNMILSSRLIVSKYLTEHGSDDFNGISLVDAILPFYSDVTSISEYCTNYVEMMGVDAEGPLVSEGILLSIFGAAGCTVLLDRRSDVDLSVTITNISFRGNENSGNGSGGVMRGRIGFGTQSSSGVGDKLQPIHVLLRPGHFDLLYAKPSVTLESIPELLQRAASRVSSVTKKTVTTPSKSPVQRVLKYLSPNKEVQSETPSPTSGSGAVATRRTDTSSPSSELQQTRTYESVYQSSKSTLRAEANKTKAESQSPNGVVVGKRFTQYPLDETKSPSASPTKSMDLTRQPFSMSPVLAGDSAVTTVAQDMMKASPKNITLQHIAISKKTNITIHGQTSIMNGTCPIELSTSHATFPAMNSEEKLVKEAMGVFGVFNPLDLGPNTIISERAFQKLLFPEDFTFREKSEAGDHWSSSGAGVLMLSWVVTLWVLFGTNLDDSNGHISESGLGGKYRGDDEDSDVSSVGRTAKAKSTDVCRWLVSIDVCEFESVQANGEADESYYAQYYKRLSAKLSKILGLSARFTYTLEMPSGHHRLQNGMRVSLVPISEPLNSTVGSGILSSNGHTSNLRGDTRGASRSKSTSRNSSSTSGGVSTSYSSYQSTSKLSPSASYKYSAKQLDASREDSETGGMEEWIGHTYPTSRQAVSKEDKDEVTGTIFRTLPRSQSSGRLRSCTSDKSISDRSMSRISGNGTSSINGSDSSDIIKASSHIYDPDTTVIGRQLSDRDIVFAKKRPSDRYDDFQSDKEDSDAASTISMTSRRLSGNFSSNSGRYSDLPISGSHDISFLSSGSQLSAIDTVGSAHSVSLDSSFASSLSEDIPMSVRQDAMADSMRAHRCSLSVVGVCSGSPNANTSSSSRMNTSSSSRNNSIGGMHNVTTDMMEDDSLMTLPCGHHFHPKCLLKCFHSTQVRASFYAWPLICPACEIAQTRCICTSCAKTGPYSYFNEHVITDEEVSDIIRRSNSSHTALRTYLNYHKFADLLEFAVSITDTSPSYVCKCGERDYFSKDANTDNRVIKCRSCMKKYCTMCMFHPHVGSSCDEFLKEKNVLRLKTAEWIKKLPKTHFT